MNTLELRLNNLILENGEIRKIYQLDMGGISFYHINDLRINKQNGLEQNSYNEVLKPIPLTEEILLKCGFENTGIHFSIKTGYYFDVRQEKKQSKLSINHTGADNYFVVSPGNGSIYLKSLHQLQNLYFALTQTELIINL